MTETIKIWLIHMGWTSEFAQIVAAGLFVTCAVLIGEIAARRVAPRLCAVMQRGVGGKSAALRERMADLLRFGAGGLFLLLPLGLIAFQDTALIIVSAGFSGAAAMLIVHALRVTGVPMWITALLGIGTFALTMTGAFRGVMPLTESLDATALNVGARRITLLSVVNSLIVAALLFAATRIVNRIITHFVGRLTALDLTQRALLQKLAGIGVVIIAILFGVDILGIDLTTLTVFSGALGLAVGFGLQKTFGNLIAGLILLMDKSVKPGDVVAVGDTFGAINKIGVRAVSVITRDGKEHLIPNEQLMTQSVENWSFSSRDVRIHIPVVISYGSDLRLAQELMIRAAKASHRVLPQPEPSVWLLAFGERGLEHDIMVWIIDPEQGVGNVQSDILNRLWALFQEHGIGLPYPQRDIHFHREPKHLPGSANLPPKSDDDVRT